MDRLYGGSFQFSLSAAYMFHPPGKRGHETSKSTESLALAHDHVSGLISSQMFPLDRCHVCSAWDSGSLIFIYSKSYVQIVICKDG